MSGSDGHPAPLDAILYPSLNKIYYCHRHGYTFKHAISRQYVGYFGPKFLEVMTIGLLDATHFFPLRYLRTLLLV